MSINYVGTGNNSQFSYDGFGYIVKIVETASSTVISTKQFVWDDVEMCEARDASGAISSQYFAYGEAIAANPYYYTLDDSPGSVRELTDGSGNTQAAYSYDPYGRVTKLRNSVASDFQYCGYYFHSPSGLSSTLNRAYNANLGRWINRDPIEEAGGVNLYSYALNDPIDNSDPEGTATLGCIICPGVPWWPFGSGRPQPAPIPPKTPLKGSCRKDKVPGGVDEPGGIPIIPM